MTLDVVLWSMFIGLMLGAFAMLYHKLVGGAVVRRLFDEKAALPEQAMTLKQMGLEKNILVRFALRKGSGLRKVVLSTEPDAKVTDETLFYLPEEKYPRAALQYDNNGTSVLTVFFAIVLFAVMMVGIRSVVPYLTQMLRNFVDMVKGQ